MAEPFFSLATCSRMYGKVSVKIHFQQMLSKKDVVKYFVKFTGKHLYLSLFSNNIADLTPEACNYIKRKTPTEGFSCEFCEIFK